MTTVALDQLSLFQGFTAAQPGSILHDVIRKADELAAAGVIEPDPYDLSPALRKQAARIGAEYGRQCAREALSLVIGEPGWQRTFDAWQDEIFDLPVELALSSADPEDLRTLKIELGHLWQRFCNDAAAGQWDSRVNGD